MSPWKPCGSYATFSPAAWLVGLEKGEGGDSKLRGWGASGLRVEGGEDTVLNVTWMQYLKAAQRQYSTLSLSFSPSPSPPLSLLLLVLFPFFFGDIFAIPFTIGYNKTILNRGGSV